MIRLPIMGKVDPVLWLLLGAFILTLGALIIVVKLFPNDGQTFQVLANLCTGWASGFMLRVKPASKEDEKPPGAKLTETNTSVLINPDPAQPKI